MSNSEQKLNYWDIIKAKVCPYCGKTPRLVNSQEIYGRSRDYGNMYWCEPCDAYVGTHANSKDVPLGRLANRELRKYKKLAHYYFDPLWKAKAVIQGKGVARWSAYDWLAREMGKQRKVTHIGMFDIDECKQVISLCKPYHFKNLEQDAL